MHLDRWRSNWERRLKKCRLGRATGELGGGHLWLVGKGGAGVGWRSSLKLWLKKCRLGVRGPGW